MKRQLGIFMLVLVLLQTLLPSMVLSAKADNIVDDSEIDYVEIPVTGPLYPSGTTIDDSIVDPEPENDLNAPQAAESGEVVDASEITYFEIPVIDPRFPPVNAIDNSEGDPNAVQAADKRAAECIDRFKLPRFARDFYNILEQESKPASTSGLGRDGFLIDPTKAPSTFLFSDGANYVVPISYPTERELKSAGFEFKDHKEFVQNCIHAVYSAFNRDHPEVFWLSGSIGLYTDTNARICYFSLAKVGFPEGTWEIRTEGYRDSAVIKDVIDALNASVNSIVSAANRKFSNYEKIAYFNEWLTTNNQYNYTVAYTADKNVSPMIYTSAGALTTKDGRPGGGRIGVDGPVCEGYSRAFQLLCHKANIPCVLVSGAGHMWNYVQVDPSDSRWYAVDTTWNDPVMRGQPSKDEYTSLGANSGMESTAYTLVGADTIVYDGNAETFLDQHPIENITGSLSFVTADFKMGPELNKLAYVDSVIIADLDAPEAGAVPDTSVTLTSDPKDDHHPTAAGAKDVLINPMVTWSPAPINGRFAANTVYTATITYTTLRQGYGLTPADASKITVAGASKVTVNANGAIQAVFSKNRPGAADFTCRLPANLTYDGSSKTAAVRRSVSSSIHNGYFTLAFTDEQNNPVTDLVKPGTYHVLANISAHGGYDAAEVDLGSVTIRETSGLHGKVSISVGDSSSQENSGIAYVIPGEAITIHISPDPGYQLNSLEVIRNDNGRKVSLSGSGTAYTFKMPATDVSIQVDFSIS